MHMPQKFKDVVEFLGKLYPPTSDLEYRIANLAVLRSIGKLRMQGPHVDTYTKTADTNNISFIYAMSDSTSIIYYKRMLNNELLPFRILIPRGSICLFHGDCIHGGSDYDNPYVYHYRFHGFIDNKKCKNYPQGFKPIDFIQDLTVLLEKMMQLDLG